MESPKCILWTQVNAWVAFQCKILFHCSYPMYCWSERFVTERYCYRTFFESVYLWSSVVVYASTYEKRCTSFKRHHCRHTFVRSLHWHDCWGIHPLEGSREARVSHNKQDDGGGCDNLSLIKEEKQPSCKRQWSNSPTRLAWTISYTAPHRLHWPCSASSVRSVTPS